MHFNQHPTLMLVGDKKQGGYLQEHLNYEGYGYYITAPKWFYTDGGSIPWIASWIVSKWGFYYREFIIHDYMYSTGEYSRQVCDTLLRDNIRDAGSWAITAYIIYAALRTFGGFAWKKHRKESQSLG